MGDYSIKIFSLPSENVSVLKGKNLLPDGAFSFLLEKTLFRRVWLAGKQRGSHKSCLPCKTLRKHTYSNILKISQPKPERFQIKILIFVIFLLKNIECGYSLEPPHRGGSNEYLQSMSLSRNKKNNVCPCIPEFYFIGV